MARRLDGDPELTDVICFSLLQYAEAHAVYKRGEKAEMKAWRRARTKLMKQVQDIDFDLAEESIARAQG